MQGKIKFMMGKYLGFRYIFIFVCFFCVCFSSCSKNEEETSFNTELKLTSVLNDIESNNSGAAYKWYYFSPEGVFSTDSPLKVQQTIFKPWTETMRVAGAANINNTGYMLVNRLGLLYLPSSLDKEPRVYTDALYFTGTTVNNLLAVEKHPVFHVYRNSFFNKNASENLLPFLIQYRQENEIFFPLLKVTDLGLPKEAETVHLQYDGSSWTGSFKISTDERTIFNYIQFYSYEPLISLTGSSKPGQIQQQKLTQEKFKEVVCNYDYSVAPSRLKKLLAQIPEEYSLIIDYSSLNPGTPINYTRETGTEVFEAKAKDGGSFIASLFADGTIYFSGALPSNPILKNGEPIVFRLPKLPSGFIYTDFVITGSILYAGWEEELFYQTGRAGFIAVDLKKVLYK